MPISALAFYSFLALLACGSVEAKDSPRDALSEEQQEKLIIRSEEEYKAQVGAITACRDGSDYTVPCPRLSRKPPSPLVEHFLFGTLRLHPTLRPMEPNDANIGQTSSFLASAYIN